MEKPQGYDEAQAFTGEYEILPANGYICKIVNAKEEKSRTGKKMLVLFLDIDEGDYKGYFIKRYEEMKKNRKDPNEEVKYPTGGIYRQLTEDNSTGYFKGMITSLETSNPTFKWDWDEKKLIGLKCGAIFGEEEYEKMNGKIGTSVKVQFIRSVDCIKNKKFIVPDKKELPQKGEAFEDFAATVSNDDLPF